MKINNQTFNLNEELIVSIDQQDNDGLINIPKNINLDINIVILKYNFRAKKKYGGELASTLK